MTVPELQKFRFYYGNIELVPIVVSDRAVRLARAGVEIDGMGYISASHAAELCGVSRVTIYNAVKDDKLRTVLDGGLIMVSKADVLTQFSA